MYSTATYMPIHRYVVSSRVVEGCCRHWRRNGESLGLRNYKYLYNLLILRIIKNFVSILVVLVALFNLLRNVVKLLNEWKLKINLFYWQLIANNVVQSVTASLLKIFNELFISNYKIG